MFKVAFDLRDGTESGFAAASTERLWTEKTTTRMVVQVRNIPFFVQGVTFGDTVRVRADHDRRELVFEELLARSGHSTVQINIPSQDAAAPIEAVLQQLGCSWETAAAGKLWAVDVPPEADYASARAALLLVVAKVGAVLAEASIAAHHSNNDR
jgi:CYTH domain-containing protein